MGQRGSSVGPGDEAPRFIQKPWDNARLLTILRTQIDLRNALRQASRLEAENRLLRAESRPTLIAEAAVMQPVLDLIGRGGSPPMPASLSPASTALEKKLLRKLCMRFRNVPGNRW